MLWRMASPLLLLVLAGALLLPFDLGLRLDNADSSATRGLNATLDRLPADPTVLVGFDPDLGTYAELRPTVRVLLADLLARGARLAFISLTPEGRALAIAEFDRLDRLEANPRQIVDLGFLPGAEAALVALARGLGPDPAQGTIGVLPEEAELPQLAMAVVIGGNDLGPRSWVEQVAPRTDGLEIVAVAPTVLLPELQPYLVSGQLAALLATPRDGAAYRASVELGPLERMVEPALPSTLAILLGLVAAIAVLGQAVAARLAIAVRAGRSREAS
jgi:hypothetical protein